MTLVFGLLGIWHYLLGNIDMVFISIFFIGVCLSSIAGRKRRQGRHEDE